MKPATKPEGWLDATASDLAGMHASIRFTPKIGQVITIPENATVWKRPIYEPGTKTIRRRKRDNSEIFAFYIVCTIDDCERPIPMGAFNAIPDERAEYANQTPLISDLVNAADDEARFNLLRGKKVQATGFFDGHGPDFTAQPGDDGRYPLKPTKFTIWSES